MSEKSGSDDKKHFIFNVLMRVGGIVLPAVMKLQRN
jgi:hypothetical protein